MVKIQGVLAAGLAVYGTCMAWSLFQALVLEHCDPKFGCSGMVQLAAIYCGYAGVISAMAFLFASTLIKPAGSSGATAKHVGSAVVGGVTLPLLVITTPNWSAEMEVMVAGWFILSAAVFAVLLSLVKMLWKEST